MDIKMREQKYYTNAKKLLNYGSTILRAMFIESYQKQIPAGWQNSIEQKDTLVSQLTKKLSKKQKKTIREKSINDWDITLLFVVLGKTWPDAFLKSDKKDCEKKMNGVEDIKNSRNTINHVGEELRCSELEYIQMKKLFQEGMEKFGKTDDEIREVFERAEKIENEYEITDSTIWNDLSEDLQSQFAEKQVMNQGEPVKLSFFGDLTQLDKDLLYQLKEEKRPEIINNQAPNVPPYYIERNFIKRQILKPGFENSVNDCFVVENSSKKSLQTLFDNNPNGYVIFTNEYDFENFCKTSNRPVHWINYRGGVPYVCLYELVTSKPNDKVQNLEKYIQDFQPCFDETDMIFKTDKVIIISGSAGTGKTNVVASMAAKIMKVRPRGIEIVRFIVMKEFVQQLEGKVLTVDVVVDLICEQSSDFDFGKQYLRKKLNNLNSTKCECVLIFDAFDEVLPTQIQLAMQVLQLAKTLPSVQIYVTTKSSLPLRELLEDDLKAVGSSFTIKPFDKAVQKEFMLNFWEKSTKNVERNKATEALADDFLEELSVNTIESGRDIAGIPLQCFLLANMNVDHAKECSEKENEVYQKPQKVKSNSIFQLYFENMWRGFVEIAKYDTFLNRISLSLSGKTNEYDEIKNVHMYYALKELFPQQAEQLKSLSNFKDINESVSELCKYGIIEGSTTKRPRFVHRNFAEFFAAWFAVERYNDKSSEDVNFIMSHIFSTTETNNNARGLDFPVVGYKFNFPLLCSFVNEFTKHTPKNNRNHQVTTFSSLIMSNKFSKVEPIFLAATFHKYNQIPEAVTRHYVNKNFKNYQNIMERNLKRLLINATYFNNRELLEIFCEDVATLTIRSNEEILKFAIQLGHYGPVKFFYSKYRLQWDSLVNLLRPSVCDTELYYKATNESITKIFYFLIEENQSLIHDFITRIIFKDNFYWGYIELLVEAGLDLSGLDEEKNSILHKLPNEKSPHLLPSDMYLKVIRALDKHKFMHFNLCNKDSVTPLQYAVKYVKWEKEDVKDVLKFFKKQKGVDFNHADNDGNSVLFYAISSPYSQLALIAELITHGVNLKHLNKSGKNVQNVCSMYKKHEVWEIIKDKY